jgi:hypothetical protein
MSVSEAEEVFVLELELDPVSGLEWEHHRPPPWPVSAHCDDWPSAVPPACDDWPDAVQSVSRCDGWPDKTSIVRAVSAHDDWPDKTLSCVTPARTPATGPVDGVVKQ